MNFSAILLISTNFIFRLDDKFLIQTLTIMDSEDDLPDQSEPQEPVQSDEHADKETSFADLGVISSLCKVCDQIGWKKPTKIQRESIPHSLQGRDVIGLAETGSGKTGAFALPIMQDLLDKGGKLFALILTPTRELAFQISEHFQALGATFGINCVVIVGGVDLMTQSLQLAKRPHIVIATPGKLLGTPGKIAATLHKQSDLDAYDSSY